MFCLQFCGNCLNNDVNFVRYVYLYMKVYSDSISVSYLFNYCLFLILVLSFIIFCPLAAETNNFPRLWDIKGFLSLILIFKCIVSKLQYHDNISV